MSNKPRIQDDLYHHVNGEWLEKAVIPNDRPTTGGFSDLDQEVEKLLMNEFKEFADGKLSTDIEEMNDAIRLYKKIVDAKRRNEEGIKPILPLLERIKNIKTVDDLNKNAADLMLNNIDLPLNGGVTEDMADATKHSFILLGPDIILPDTTYYEDGNQAGQQLLQVYAQMADALLQFTPLSEEERKQYVADTLAFDALVAKRVKSQVEWADYVNNHNPMDIEEVAEYVKPLDIKRVLKEIFGKNTPKTIIVYDPRAIKEFSLFFSEETLPLYVHWCYVMALVKGSRSLSTDLKKLGNTYRRILTGVAEDPVIEKEAYQVVGRVFAEPIGVYYGRKYFGEEAKKDVVSLVHQIIDTYKNRVRKNSFLEESTKEKAILKLSTIAVKMGYPDVIDPFYKELKVNEEDSYFEAMQKLMKAKIRHNLEDLTKPVDRNKWAMPGHMVNACYNPSANDITFPAAILQKPFYSIHQSVSENLGGIGAVIGHEISHAFDNNGAHFDENGNLFDWWKESDFKAFKELTNDMIKQFDGIPFHGGKVNGELVVSENIADNGGMGVTIEIMHKLDKPDFKAYFINWAKVWCMKAKEEYINLLLASDVHSPAELRANMQVRNFDEWYETFDVKETDKMFIPKEKRISIW